MALFPSMVGRNDLRAQALLRWVLTLGESETWTLDSDLNLSPASDIHLLFEISGGGDYFSMSSILIYKKGTI